jgi:subtilisin family serine protease
MNTHSASSKIGLRGIIIIFSLLAVGCAGGGGGQANLSPTPPPTPAPPPAAPTAADYETHEYNIQYGLGQMNVSHAYAAGAFGAGTTVAVIDSGIDDSYTELAGQVSPNSISIWEQQGGTLGSLTHGHGTFIGAVIAARRNDTEAHGVAPETTLLDIRVDRGVENPNIPGSSYPLYTETDFALAIDYAVSQGVNIISLSIARPPSAYEHNGTAIYAALRRAVDAGIIITIGTANYSAGTPLADRIIGDFLPASFADDPLMNGQIVVVPALNSSDTITDFSARAGVLSNFAISAAGEDIFIGLDANTRRLVRGVSFSGPHIAGALALLIGAFPNLEGVDALNLLYDTARDLGAPGVDDVYGHGVPDLMAAFTPQGQTELKLANGTISVSIDELMAGPSGAFGDWAWNSGLYNDAVFKDSYDRVFSLRGWMNQHRPGLTAQSSFENAANLSRSPTRTVALPNNASLSIRHPVETPRIYRQFDEEMGRTTAAISFHQSIGDLEIAAGRGFAAPAPVPAAGLSVLSQTAFSGAAAGYASHDNWQAIKLDRAGWQLGIRASGSTQVGFQALSLTRRMGDQVFGLEVGKSAEQDTALGSFVGNRLGNRSGSQNSFQAAVWSGALPSGWTGGARVEFVTTNMSLSEHIQIDETPMASAWTLAAHRPLFGGQFGLTVNQPLRIEQGAISSQVAVGVDEDWNLVYETRSGKLAPSGREIGLEAAYQWSLFGGADASIATRYAVNSGHIADNEDEVSLWFGLRSRR